ncbi:MAG TPA: hypothetical protein VKT19_00025, partial [Steroidobacteraceae bacterium]|nr:hypothetical protein [Steroidobacteraceae bacterium]
RAAIASLEDSGIHSPALDALPTLAPAVIPVAQPAQAAQTPQSARAAASSEVDATLSDSATLRLLETGAAAGAPATASDAVAARTVRMAAPKAVPGQSVPSGTPSKASQAPREEKPCYAVQLVWAVQPIDMTQVPQLAIFSAYTLYGAEGNRDGRRWYGLRLGFFTDAVSAKQVAQYVRGDFATVSVVPVTPREREQAVRASSVTGASGHKDAARDSARAAPTPAAPAKSRNARTVAKQPEFAFIEGTEASVPRAVAPVSPPAKGPRVIGGRPTRGAPGKRAKVRKPGQIDARTPVKPKTLEETLEILGANQLQVDDGKGASINDSGVRHLSLERGKGRPSKLSRLIGRLSERMGS